MVISAGIGANIALFTMEMLQELRKYAYVENTDTIRFGHKD